MQGCLGPAHGMHTVIKPDRAGLSYSSEEGPLHSINNTALPIRGMVLLGSILHAVSPSVKTPEHEGKYMFRSLRPLGFLLLRGRGVFGPCTRKKDSFGELKRQSILYWP